MAAFSLKGINFPRNGFHQFRAQLLKTVILCGLALSTIQAQNNIDGVTSASGDLKLKSGKAYATEAIIVWSDHRSNGQIQTLEWGTSTTSYGTPMNLKPFTRDTEITDTLKPLTPSTKYYAKFRRTYTKDNLDLSTTFEFTTPASTAVAPVIEKNKFVGTPAAAYIALFSPDGRKVVERSFSECFMNANVFQGVVTPGLYVAVTSDRAHQTLQSVKVMVEK